LITGVFRAALLAAVIVIVLVVVGPCPCGPLVAVIVYAKILPDGGAVTVQGLLLNGKFYLIISVSLANI
jgi:hypothetical protein